MWYHRIVCCQKPLLLIVAAVFLLPLAGMATEPILELTVDDAFACPGQKGATIPIYLRNVTDTVFMFQLWMILERPDIMKFIDTNDSIDVTTYWACDQYEGETCLKYIKCTNDWFCTQYSGDFCIDSEFTLGYWHCWDMVEDSCLDSIFLAGYDSTSVERVAACAGSLDTVGTLTGGWSWLHTRSLSGQYYDLKILGVADLYWPYEIDGIPPRSEEGLFLKVYADIYDIPDTTTDRDVHIYLPRSHSDVAPIFHDRYCNLIGKRIDTIPDTHFFRCQLWIPPDNEICLGWERVYEPPYDSIFVDIREVTSVDTFKVVVNNGSLTVLKCLIGDINGDDQYNLLDILALIDHIYEKDYTSDNTWKGDFNCDCTVNLLDILSLIDMLYTEPIGDPLPCRYPTWQALCESR